MPSENGDKHPDKVTIYADATSLVPPRTGVGKYALNILTEMSRLDDISMVYFHGHRWSKNISHGENSNFKYLRTLIRGVIRKRPTMKKIARFIRGVFFKLTSFLATRKQTGKHIFYSPNYKLPANYAPKIIVVHDLCSERLPHLVDSETLRWLSDLRNMVTEAEAVITISEFTRQEIISFYNTPKEKIRIAPPGIDDIFTQQCKLTVSSVLKKYDLDDDPYFIAVSTLQPRKNITTLLEAYLGLPEKLKSSTQLLLIGDNITTHLNAIHGKGLLDHPSIKYLGYVPYEDLPAFYSGALSYCSTSLYEGFGIPIAEAFACGTPCLLSDIPPYHEISPHQDTFFDPMDVDAWTQGMTRAIEDPEWIRSKTVDEKSIRKRFNWKSSASITLDILRESARLSD